MKIIMRRIIKIIEVEKTQKGKVKQKIKIKKIKI